MRWIWRNRWTRWIALGGLLLVLHVGSYPVSLRLVMGSDTWREAYEEAHPSDDLICFDSAPGWDPPKPTGWVCYRPLEWCIRRTVISKPVFVLAKWLDVDKALAREIDRWELDAIFEQAEKGNIAEYRVRIREWTEKRNRRNLTSKSEL